MYDEITSADWLYEAFNNSPATESGMLQLRPGCLFAGIGHFDDSSNTDCLMKNSEHPIPTNNHLGWSWSIPLSVAGDLLNAS